MYQNNQIQHIGLFYGSSTCYTEIVAENICSLLKPGAVHLHNIAEADIKTIESYTELLFGIPTWDYGELQEDWDDAWDSLDDLCLRGKTAAIFGLGDEIGYGDWYQDAMGFLHFKLLSLGADIKGHWPCVDYSFQNSKALTANGTHFVGLALDQENHPEKTEERLKIWLSQIYPETLLNF